MSFIIMFLLALAAVFFGYRAEKAPLKSDKRRKNTVISMLFLALLFIIIVLGI